MADLTDTDDSARHVRERYAAAAQRMPARAATPAAAAAASHAPSVARTPHRASSAPTSTTPRRPTALRHRPSAASLGCGVPTAVADLHEGETVLDLGSGAGADVLISARRVGPAGRAIGLDMTDEMLALARANAADAGVANAEFVKGYLEEIPLARRERRRRHLQLRHQPRRRQDARPARGRARPAPRRAASPSPT